MNSSKLHKHVLLAVLLLHSTSVQSHGWSYYWDNLCTTISALSSKVKLTLVLTAATLVALVCAKKKKPSSSSGLEGNPVIDRQVPVNRLDLQPRVLHGSEAIVNAMLDNAPSEQILPLIAAASPEELNRESHIFLPLGLACSKGLKDVIKTLVEQGADVNRSNRDGEEPLEILIDHYRGPCDLPIIKYMLDNGANPRNYRHPGVQTLLDQYRSPQQLQSTSTRRRSVAHIVSGSSRIQ